MKLTDIHCHILPGIDDGAKNLKEAKEMLSLAQSDGIRNIICTPHYHIGRVKASAEDCMQAFEELTAYAEEKFPELTLYLGQEIYYYSETLEKLERGELLTLADTDYILLEYSHTTQYEEIRDSISDAYGAGFLPVIAHIERYPCMADPDKVKRLVRSGAYIQVNAETLLLPFTNRLRRFAFKMIKEDLVHFIASDAHSAETRKPELSEAYRLVEKKFGSEIAERIFLENPQLLLENKEL